MTIHTRYSIYLRGTTNLQARGPGGVRMGYEDQTVLVGLRAKGLEFRAHREEAQA